MDIATPPMTRIELAELGPASFVLSARGALGLADSVQLRDRLFPLLAIEGATIVLDIGAVHAVDPAVVGVIKAAAKLFRRGSSENELVVVARDPRVIWLLELTGIDRIARIERTLQVAGDV